jgi:hypothetical protein
VAISAFNGGEKSHGRNLFSKETSSKDSEIFYLKKFAEFRDDV